VVIVASRSVPSGVAGSAVKLSVSDALCPTASVTGAKPLTLKSGEEVDDGVTVSGTFPALVSVIVSGVEIPAIALTVVGLALIETAWIAGMVNVTTCVCVIAGLLVLVAVTLNDSTVPGGGIVCPLLSCR
jgi:hypothetical protein